MIYMSALFMIYICVMWPDIDMRLLDGDNDGLKSSRNVKAERDIVQFVKYYKITITISIYNNI